LFTNLFLKSLPISNPEVIEETTDVLINVDFIIVATNVKKPTLDKNPSTVTTPPTTSEIRSLKA
jgi:hypothetical protein